MNIIDKGQLDAFEGWLVRVRQEGLIDPNVVSDDEAKPPTMSSRSTAMISTLSPVTPVPSLGTDLINYAPISMWEGLDTYCEVMVEKID